MPVDPIEERTEAALTFTPERAKRPKAVPDKALAGKAVTVETNLSYS